MVYPTEYLGGLTLAAEDLGNWFVVVRHGQTHLNALAGDVDGVPMWVAQGSGTHVGLNETGKRQAVDAGNVLKKFLSKGIIRQVVCSPSERAVLTAVYAGAADDEIIYDPDIEERNFGELEGKLVEEKVFTEDCFDCEKTKQVAQRVRTAWRKYARTDGTLFVTHGGPIRVLELFSGVRLSDEHMANAFPLFFGQKNSTWSVAALEDIDPSLLGMSPPTLTAAMRMTSENSGRVVLISGANRGIGLAIARELYEQGYRLSLGARKVDMLEMKFGKENERLHYARFDANDLSTSEAWVQSAVEKFGGIDVLVNNAGHSELTPFMEVDQAVFKRHMEVNAMAPLHLTQLCMSNLEKTGKGRIIFMSSMSGVRAVNDKVAYNMSKAAVKSLAQTISNTFWRQGIRATVICPSFVDTEMASYTTKIKPEQMIRPETVALVVRHAIELPNTAVIPVQPILCLNEAWV